MKRKKKKIRKIFTGMYKAAVNAERIDSGYGADPTNHWLEDAIPFNAALIKAEPKIMVIVETLFPAIIKFIIDHKKIKKPYTPNNRSRIKYTCKAVLFNLYLAYLVGSPIRYARNASQYGRARRYGQLFFKYDRLIPVIAAFEHLGLIQHKMGWHDRDKQLGRQSRMWASEKLVAMFNKMTQGYPCQVFAEEPVEPVVLKDSKENNKKRIDYIDTPATNLIRNNLKYYNDFIADAEIAVASSGNREVSLYNLKNKLFLNLLKGDGALTNIKFSNKILKNSINKNSVISSNINNTTTVNISNIIYNTINNYKSNNYISITNGNFISPVEDHVSRDAQVYVDGEKLTSLCCSSKYCPITFDKIGRLDELELPFILSRYHEPSQASIWLKQLSSIINKSISSLHTKDGLIPDETLLKKLFREKLELKNFDIEQLNFVINQKKLYRVFNEKSFERGGRFYGALYQYMPKGFRKDILINGEPAIELDYSAHHIRIPYHLEGIDYRDDPYLALTDDPEERKIFKKLLLVALNATTEKKAIEAFRSECIETAWKTELSLADESIRGLLARARDQHKRIAGFIHSGKGRMLQNLDSRITEGILMRMTDMAIPCLPVHDSYIVPRQHEDRLRDVMGGTYKEAIGFEPVIG
jgi:hypothetical protein